MRIIRASACATGRAGAVLGLVVGSNPAGQSARHNRPSRLRPGGPFFLESYTYTSQTLQKGEENAKKGKRESKKSSFSWRCSCSK